MTDAHDHPDDHDHPDEAFAAAVRDAISDGPRPLDELAAQLHAAGALDRHIAEFSDTTDGGDGGEGDTGNTRPDWIVDLVDDLLLDVAGIWVDDDNDVHLAASAFDGVILTHRVDPSEIERGALDATPDLAAIAAGLQGERPLLGPVPGWVHLAYPFSRDDDIADELGSFIGPDGWLHDVAAGQLVALRRVGDAIELITDVELDEPNEPPGRELSTPTEPEDHGAGRPAADHERRDDTAMFLLSRYERLVEPGIGVDVDELVLETMVRGSASFRRVLPPISDQLAQVGLRCVDGFVGPDDEEFAPGYDDEFDDELDEELDEDFAAGYDDGSDDVDRVERMAEKYRLNSCCREALEAAVDGLELVDTSRIGGPPPPAVVAGVADALRHGPTVPLLEQYVLDDPDGVEVDRLGALGRALVDAGTRTAGVGENLLGLYELHTGGAVTALEHLERAVGLDGPETPAAMELAALRTDTGDARRALDAWRRTPSAPGRDEHVTTLTELLGHLDGVRRNDPCPCGSGRKFKQCCALDPKLGPAERRRLALFRVAAHAAARLDDRRFGLALTAVGAEDPDDRPHHDHDHDHDHHHDHDHDESDVVASLRRWQAEPLLLDIVVHEEGGLEGYLDERGDLVPDDIRAWLTSLIDQPRTLWEVTLIDPMVRSATARSVLTGERFDVTLRDVDPDIGRHAHVIGRLVPDAVDGGPGFVGIVHVVPPGLARATVHLVDNSPTPDELAAWAAGGSVSPTLPDPEGDPLWMATIRLGLIDDERDRSRTALDERYVADGDDRWRLVVDLGEHPDPEVTVATLEVAADELIATVHGGGRLGRLRDELETAGFTWIGADLNPEIA